MLERLKLFFNFVVRGGVVDGGGGGRRGKGVKAPLGLNRVK